MQVNIDKKEEGHTEEVNSIKRHSNGEGLSKQRELHHKNEGESAPSILKAARPDGSTHGEVTMEAHKN